MTVTELRERLSDFPGELDVEIWASSGYAGNYWCKATEVFSQRRKDAPETIVIEGE